MIILIQGPAGSGKTFLMSRLILREWTRGVEVYSNFNLFFDEERTNIRRWYTLDETYGIENGIIAIDESQAILDAREWQKLPPAFKNKIAMHRHDHLDIYTTTQDMGHVDIRLRSNIHELYTCASVLRFPRNERVKPDFQIIRVSKKERSFDSENQRVKWVLSGKPKLYFISRFWTKKYYDTYNKLALTRMICQIEQDKNKRKQLIGKLYSREILSAGKARM